MGWWRFRRVDDGDEVAGKGVDGSAGFRSVGFGVGCGDGA